MAIRANTGSAPDLNALRRARPADQAGWTRLPNHGLTGDLPEWPLEVEEPDMQEMALWNRMWRDFPQAHVWRRQHNEVQVAIYIRTAIFAASRSAKAPILTSFRQQSDALLLTPLALRSSRHTIDDQSGEPVVDMDVAQAGPLALVTPIKPPSVRDRMAGAQPAVAAEPEDDEDDEPTGPEEDEFE